ncbi:hypothetical protein [Rhizobium sp.]|uniref:hypothetical protein n=1 Tax=Rhizobium sp. TaxID=391 RepID=UPI00289AD024
MNDDHHQPQRGWFARTKPYWVATGLVVAGGMNVVATVSAGFSAYYTSQQAVLATKAVNQASRNEAFSKYVEAYQGLCALTLSGLDGTISEQVTIEGQTINVMTVPYDMVTGISPDPDYSYDEKSLTAFSEGAFAADMKIDAAFNLLSIWLSREEIAAIRELYWSKGHYNKTFMSEQAMPILVQAMLLQNRCRQSVDVLMDFYRGEIQTSLVDDKRLNSFIIPWSDVKKRKEMFASWDIEADYEALLKFSPSLVAETAE